MCFPFYKDLSGIMSWNKFDKYLELRHLSVADLGEGPGPAPPYF